MLAIFRRLLITLFLGLCPFTIPGAQAGTCLSSEFLHFLQTERARQNSPELFAAIDAFRQLLKENKESEPHSDQKAFRKQNNELVTKAAAVLDAAGIRYRRTRLSDGQAALIILPVSYVTRLNRLAESLRRTTGQVKLAYVPEHLFSEKAEWLFETETLYLGHSLFANRSEADFFHELRHYGFFRRYSRGEGTSLFTGEIMPPPGRSLPGVAPDFGYADGFSLEEMATYAYAARMLAGATRHWEELRAGNAFKTMKGLMGATQQGADVSATVIRFMNAVLKEPKKFEFSKDHGQIWCTVRLEGGTWVRFPLSHNRASHEFSKLKGSRSVVREAKERLEEMALSRAQSTKEIAQKLEPHFKKLHELAKNYDPEHPADEAIFSEAVQLRQLTLE